MRPNCTAPSLAFLALLAVTLPACGGDDPGPATEGTPPTEAVGPTEPAPAGEFDDDAPEGDASAPHGGQIAQIPDEGAVVEFLKDKGTGDLVVWAYHATYGDGELTSFGEPRALDAAPYLELDGARHDAVAVEGVLGEYRIDGASLEGLHIDGGLTIDLGGEWLVSCHVH